MQLSEEKYREIENDLIRLCNTVAIPRFMKALRNAIELDLPMKFDSLKGVEPSIADFRQEFVDWISYGNLTVNFEIKGLGEYSSTRQVDDWEEGVTRNESGHPIHEITDEDIPF